jgi:asparagine synthase (glutamine-hydrolysing)
MPGLVCVHDPHRAPDEINRVLEKMCQAVTHEPWYETHTYVSAPVGLGRVSLGIVNPQPRPIHSQDGSLTMFMEGEITDYEREPLRRKLSEKGYTLREAGSDGELLLHLFEDEGADQLHRIDGTFVAIVWDHERQKLTVFNDRHALWPIHYYQQGDKLLLGTEAKAILQDHAVNRVVNKRAVNDFFTFRHVLEDETVFEGIMILPPASVLTFQDGNLSLQEHRIFEFTEDFQDKPIAEYVSELARVFRRAVKRQLAGDFEIGSFLSGGLDSRCIVMMVEREHYPFKTFTRGTAGGYDCRFAQMVASHLGTDHSFLEYRPVALKSLAPQGVWLTEGMMTCIDFYALNGLDRIRQSIQVILNGIVGGPILGGDAFKSDMIDVTDEEELAQKLHRRSRAFMSDSFRALLYSKGFHDQVRGESLNALRRVLGTEIPPGSGANRADYYGHRYIWPRTSYYGTMLIRHKIEARFPFFDNDLFDFVYTIPPKMRVARHIEIELLRAVQPDLGQIPWQYTGIPAAASTYRRQRFQRALHRLHKELSWLTRGVVPYPRKREQADYAYWFRTSLRDWLKGVLLDDLTLSRGYFNPEFVRKMVEDHMAKKRDYSVYFGLLLTFELWHRMFIDGEGPSLLLENP